MTLQQLEYVLAVAEYQHFQKASDACGITQSTLSTMIHKLEEELDTVIFDRNSHPILPTAAGKEIVEQAREVLHCAKKLRELTLNEQQKKSGKIRMAFTPTIAPYIVPQLINAMNSLPDIELRIGEFHRDKIIKRLRNGELDMGIMSLATPVDGLLEIPLYHERLLLYVSDSDPLAQEPTPQVRELPWDRIWALHNEFGFAPQIFDINAFQYPRVTRYSSGNLATLLRIVDANDGFTVIPEMHLPLLDKQRLAKVHPVTPAVQRQVSLFIREDYVREGLLNLIIDRIKEIIPEEMIDPYIKKNAIKLR